MIFKDITPLLADGPAFAAVVDALAGVYGPVDKVAGIEARGFILAAPVAVSLRAGFVPIRKKGKLPGPTYAQDYQLEYATATIEVHTDAFASSDRVLVIDDVLATGRHRPRHGRPGAPLRRHGGGHRRAARAVLPGRPSPAHRPPGQRPPDRLADLPVSALLTV